MLPPFPSVLLAWVFLGLSLKLATGVTWILNYRDRNKQIDLWGGGMLHMKSLLKPCYHWTVAQAGSCDLTPAGSQRKFSLAQSTSCQACQLPSALPFQLMKEPGRDQPRHGEAILHGGRRVCAALALPCYTGSAVLPSGQHRPKFDEEKSLNLLCHLKTCTQLSTKEQDSFKKHGGRKGSRDDLKAPFTSAFTKVCRESWPSSLSQTRF